MAAQGIMTELVAHRSVQAFEPFPHIDALDRKVDLSGQPHTEQHRQPLRAFGNPDQPRQLFVAKQPGAFYAPPIRQAKCEALPCRFPLRHFYLHQLRLGAKLLPPVIECRERNAALTAELTPRHTARTELLHYPPHLGTAIGRLAHTRPSSFDQAPSSRWIRLTLTDHQHRYNSDPQPAASNTTVVGDGNNTTGFLLNRSNNNSVGGRIDYNLDVKNVINGTYSYNNNALLRPDVDITFSVTLAATQNVGTNFMSVGWRFTPTASLTNEVRFGYSRGLVAFKDTNNGTVSPGQFFVTLPSTYSTNPVDTFEPQGRNENSYAILDNAIWNHGSGTIRFGVQSNLFHVYSYNSAGIVPTYTLGISTAQTKALTTSEFPGGVNSTDFANANNLLATLAGITSSAAQTFNVTTPTSGYVNGATDGRHYP
jgi:hypothetical protein